MVNKMGMAKLCASKADAEKEAADVQRFWPHMGPHRAVQLVEAADVEALRTGYAAARLEIESLQARIKTMAEEHADELTVAHLDGMRGRSTEPAGEYPALPDADRDYMRKVVAVAVAMLFDGYKEDVMRVFSTGELSEFVTITAAMRVEKVEDIYRRAWDLLSLPIRASHRQAPAAAQAAPAAAAGCTRSHPHENMDSACRAKAAIAEMQNMAARGAEATTHDLERFVAMLAAAPTTQPAPQQEAQEPVAWYVTGCGRLLDEDEAKAEARHIGGTARAIPLYTAPQADSVLEDAKRYRWLRQEHKRVDPVCHLTWKRNLQRDSSEWVNTAVLDTAIDAARNQGANHD